MRKIFGKIVVLSTILLLLSCDKDFNTIGSEIIGDGHYEFDKYTVQNLKAYSKATGAVQSNNLPVNSLGIYKDPFFGLTKASFVSQIELSNEGISIGDNPIIDSVYLYVPYFSELKETTLNGERIYELDSVYGYNENAKFRLNVFENGFELRDFSPESGFTTSQAYFNNQKTDVDNFKGTELLNNSANLSQNEEFVISRKEIYIYKTNGSGAYVDNNGVVLSNQNNVSLRVIKERKVPGIWLDLKNSFFQQKILDQAANGIFFNNNIFKNHFKGLYFEVSELVPGEGSLAMLDFSRAELKILFKSSFGGGELLRRTLSLQMGYNSTSARRCNSINLIEYSGNTDYTDLLEQSDEVNGDDKIYIKGGQGSVAFIDLFGALNPATQVPFELEALRANNWLINEASLTFYIDTQSMSNPGQIEPERIFIFDATNNRPIIDYYADASTSTNAKNNKVGFGGIIQRSQSADKKGIKYKIRLTEHINRILNSNDENLKKNIRIGVSVTETINMDQNAYVDPSNPITIGTDLIKFIPVSSVMSPLGTVLYGTNTTDEKKMKLEIYYTKPN